MFLQINVPVPKDLPLPLPLPEWLLVSLLVISFLVHIIFINLMIGGTLLSLWAQIKGLKDNRFDNFAHEVAKTVTVNKSLAVVMGVAPLLSINTLYTLYFYSANALTGFAWIMIIPLVTIAFLLTYLHKYTWESLANNKYLHLSILGLAVAVFLFIPLIFLTNVNLMMFPDKWGDVKGFVSALLLPNVFPRYFEFLGACLTTTGLFIVWYNGRKNYPIEAIYQNQLSSHELKKIGYSTTTLGLGLQILFGVIVLFTLPSKGIGYDVVSLMFLAGTLLALALYWSYQTLVNPEDQLDRHFYKILALVALFNLIYGISRQMYRHNALHKHQALVAAHTAHFQELSAEARKNPVSPQAALQIDTSLGEFALGAAIYQANCAACHKERERLVGPPVTEMVAIYANDPENLKKWIKAPGKKRPDYPQMPGFPQIPDDDLAELSKYILSIK